MNHPITRRDLLLLGTSLAATGPAAMAQQTTSGSEAAGFPSRPIRIVVGFTPGASTDFIARAVADILSKSLNQAVVVDNRPGAGGNLAAEIVRNSAPDGHTLLLAIAAHVTNRGLHKRLPYDPIKDFTPVNLVARVPFVLVANKDFPANSVSEVIAMAKSKPGALNYATSGVGSSQHLCAENLARLAGIKWTHVAYRGGAPALLAVASNEVPVALLSTTLVLPMVQKGSIKAIAIAATRRSTLIPNVPTFAESGMPNYTADTWNGILAPAGTPTAIVERLNREISRGLASKEVADRFASQDSFIVDAGPAEFGKIMRDDDVKWFEIVREAKIQAE